MNTAAVPPDPLGERVTRAEGRIDNLADEVARLAESFGKIDTKIDTKIDGVTDKLDEKFEKYENRLPLWATMLFAVLTAACGALANAAL